MAIATASEATNSFILDRDCYDISRAFLADKLFLLCLAIWIEAIDKATL